MGSAQQRAPNTDAVGYGRRFSTNMLLYLRNCARQGQCYCRQLTGTRMRSIELDL